jgi:hypothetical protein
VSLRSVSLWSLYRLLVAYLRRPHWRLRWLRPIELKHTQSLSSSHLWFVCLSLGLSLSLSLSIQQLSSLVSLLLTHRVVLMSCLQSGVGDHHGSLRGLSARRFLSRRFLKFSGATLCRYVVSKTLRERRGRVSLSRSSDSIFHLFLSLSPSSSLSLFALSLCLPLFSLPLSSLSHVKNVRDAFDHNLHDEIDVRGVLDQVGVVIGSEKGRES